MDEKGNEKTEMTEGDGTAPAPTAQASETNELAELQKQVEQYKDLFLRKAAEFENYKRRVENEAATLAKYANEELVTTILPILDDLERSLKLSKDKKEFEPLYRGVELIQQKFAKSLEGLGVRPLETVGKPFDVNYHDALLQMPKPDVPFHTVLEEVQKGYTLGDKVIRHAKVIVSSLPADGESAETSVDDKSAQKS